MCVWVASLFLNTNQSGVTLMQVLISLASANYSSAESGSMQAVATEYIWQLCEDDITLTTLECMTSILAAVEPPPEALSKFASKCINLAVRSALFAYIIIVTGVSRPFLSYLVY